MTIRLGYVSISKTLDLTCSKTITYTNFKKENNLNKIDEIIIENLNNLEKIIDYNIKNNITTKGEIQLTDALDSVRETSGIMGFVFNGKVYDVGTPDMYRETIANYGR